MSVFVKKYADIAKLILWSDVTENQKAKLVFSFRDGNPRITVYTGVTGSTGVISFPADIPTMVYVCNILKEIAKGEPGEKQAIQSLTTLYVDNKPTAERKIVSTLYVGKSKEGLVYLSLIAEDRPKIVFTIKSSTYHTFKNSAGENIPDSVISEKMAVGLAEFVLHVIGNAITEYTKEEYTSFKKQMSVKSGSGANSIVSEFEDIPL